MRWRLGLRPRPRWGSLRRSPRPLIVSRFAPKALAIRRLEADPIISHRRLSGPRAPPQYFGQVYAYDAHCHLPSLLLWTPARFLWDTIPHYLERLPCDAYSILVHACFSESVTAQGP